MLFALSAPQPWAGGAPRGLPFPEGDPRGEASKPRLVFLSSYYQEQGAFVDLYSTVKLDFRYQICQSFSFNEKHRWYVLVLTHS